MIRSVIFDLDGTLWQPDAVVIPAYRRVFRSLGLPIPPDEVLLETLGHSFDVIWQKILPGVSAAIVAKAHALMLQAEKDYLFTLDLTPFAGVKETLLGLRSHGVQTYILSNCQRQYLQDVPDRLGIGEFWTARYCAEDFPGLSKAEIIRAVSPPIAFPAIMVGDRFHDMEAGSENGLATIACTFGFGSPEELVGATYVANCFGEVREILLELTEEV